MAHNHSNSSSDEEEEEEASGSEDEQTSNSDSQQLSDSASDDKHKPDPKKHLISSETEESDSETDSDSPPKKSTVVDRNMINIKPINPKPKPMDRELTNPESKLSKKSGSKTISTSTPVSTNKRPLNSPASEKNVKKPRNNNVSTDDDSKKQLFQRLWSEDDEIVILKGMIDYKNETGENLIADMGAFHEFIKKSLHVDVSRAQLVDKIRRLKKKYVNNASREKDGKDRSFSKSHEQKGYELSKLIWGVESKKNSNGKLGKLNGLDDREVVVMDVDRFVRYGGREESGVLPEEIVKAGMELVEGRKRVELEERWRSLKKQELELYLKKMDLVREQALVVLEAVNSSGN